VFVGNSGIPRDDGGSNVHRMFVTLGKPPYFTEIGGPWLSARRGRYAADCAVVADINLDGTDDLAVCDPKSPSGAHFYIQSKNGKFSEVRVPANNRKRAGCYWRNLRIDFVTKRSRPDLVVIEVAESGSEGSNPVPQHRLLIYEGIPNKPYFDFRQPYFSLLLPNASPDVEILDVNSDGLLDVFVAQTNEHPNTYCGAMQHEIAPYWDKSKNTHPNPPEDWVPPVDRGASDILLLNSGVANGKTSFTQVRMEYSIHGCTGLVRRFDDETAPQARRLVLAGGRRIHAGYQYVLEWNI